MFTFAYLTVSNMFIITEILTQNLLESLFQVSVDVS